MDYANRGKVKVKKFIVDVILEPLIPLKRVESDLIFWARFVFLLRRPFVIGITGSVGKSTTTALVAAVLSHRDARQIVGPVGCTMENMNDDVGLAATLLCFKSFLILPWSYAGRLAMIFRLPFRALRVVLGRYPKVMVLECGVGSTANLHRLVTIAPPNIAVVTRIGAAHLEMMKTLDGVVQEKSVLVRAVPPTGVVILGQGHAYVSQLEQAARAPVIKVPGQGVELSQNVARVICQHMGIPEEAVNSALKDFKNPKGRLNRLEFAGMTVIDDSYNANPMSMELGLDTLAETAKPPHRRLAVLGFMAELGPEGPRFHEDVGAYARNRTDILIGVGELSKLYKPDHWFDSSEACADAIENLLHLDDCVLVKGSHSARMELVVKRLRKIAERRLSPPVQA
ncbi:Mur ligase family protein [Rhodoferax ferrireducens]|uniref:Mur ligase family protein n=1 Tax=Rhodoferax ferrireducens TaxID=192843 RepID=UPI003BB66725